MKTTILVADDHVLVREGLVSLLRREEDLVVVAEASDGDQALAGMVRLRPDVAVLDVAMPLLTGIELARRARDAALPTAIVLLSMHGEPAFVTAGLDAGAFGYVVKAAVTRELIDAIRAAARQQVFLSPSIAGAAIAEIRAGVATAPPTDLSPREREVLVLLARGLSTKEIATRLRISARTVEGHRRAIMDALGIRNLPGLVKFAIRHHLTTLDD